MPDEISPQIEIVPGEVLRPIVFYLTRENVEYLLAITSGRLRSLREMEAEPIQTRELQDASGLYHTLVEITGSMDDHKSAHIELRIIPPQSP